jgi:hypothetical protein
VSLGRELAAAARTFNMNVGAATRSGVQDAVDTARAERDRQAYLAHPESGDDGWDGIEAWGSRDGDNPAAARGKPA